MECISADIIANSETAARDFSGLYYIQTVFERYAILSHTWLSEGEITYSDWAEPTVPIDPTSPGYRKLANSVNSCKTGVALGLDGYWCVSTRREAVNLMSQFAQCSNGIRRQQPA